jgi:hypothetical protein
MTEATRVTVGSFYDRIVNTIYTPDGNYFKKVSFAEKDDCVVAVIQELQAKGGPSLQELEAVVQGLQNQGTSFRDIVAEVRKRLFQPSPAEVVQLQASRQPTAPTDKKQIEAAIELRPQRAAIIVAAALLKPKNIDPKALSRPNYEKALERCDISYAPSAELNPSSFTLRNGTGHIVGTQYQPIFWGHARQTYVWCYDRDAKGNLREYSKYFNNSLPPEHLPDGAYQHTTDSVLDRASILNPTGSVSNCTVKEQPQVEKTFNGHSLHVITPEVIYYYTENYQTKTIDHLVSSALVEGVLKAATVYLECQDALLDIPSALTKEAGCYEQYQKTAEAAQRAWDSLQRTCTMSNMQIRFKNSGPQYLSQYFPTGDDRKKDE